MFTVDLQGLELLKEYDYVAIFDADFKPDTDFLVCPAYTCNCFGFLLSLLSQFDIGCLSS